MGETAVNIDGYRCYVWGAVNVDFKEVLAAYAPIRGSILSVLAFQSRVLKAYENKLLIIID